MQVRGASRQSGLKEGGWRAAGAAGLERKGPLPTRSSILPLQMPSARKESP